MALALRHRFAPPERGGDPLGRLRFILPAIAARATALDADGAFTEEDVAALAAAGLLRAPLPRGEGGAGWGTEPDEAAAPPPRRRGAAQGRCAIRNMPDTKPASTICSPTATSAAAGTTNRMVSR